MVGKKIISGFEEVNNLQIKNQILEKEISKLKGQLHYYRNKVDEDIIIRDIVKYNKYPKYSINIGKIIGDSGGIYKRILWLNLDRDIQKHRIMLHTFPYYFPHHTLVQMLMHQIPDLPNLLSTVIHALCSHLFRE